MFRSNQRVATCTVGRGQWESTYTHGWVTAQLSRDANETPQFRNCDFPWVHVSRGEGPKCSNAEPVLPILDERDLSLCESTPFKKRRRCSDEQMGIETSCCCSVQWKKVFCTKASAGTLSLARCFSKSRSSRSISSRKIARREYIGAHPQSAELGFHTTSTSCTLLDFFCSIYSIHSRDTKTLDTGPVSSQTRLPLVLCWSAQSYKYRSIANVSILEIRV